MVMRRLTLEGVSPADAAKIAIATPVSDSGQPMLTPADGYDLSDLPGFGDLGGDAGDGRGDGFGAAPADDFSSPAGLLGDSAALGADVLRAELQQSDILDLSGVAQSAAELTQGELTQGELTQGERSPGELTRTERARRDDADLMDDAADLFSDTDLIAARQAESDDPDVEVDAPDEPWRDEPGRSTDSPWLGVLRPPATDRAGGPGGGRVIALPDGTAASRGLARAAMSLDTYETNRMLRDAIRKQGVVPTWNSMIMPVLRALGERTSVTGDGIDVEHAFSEVILGVMRSATVSLQQPGNAPTVLLACADSDYHSLPLHALAASLAEREIGCRMLGSGLPPHALSAAVRRTGPAVIVLFARMPGANAASTDQLRRQRPAPTVILAGPGWQSDTVPSSARTASSLAEAIDEVVKALHAS
jgi:hypothetical protein